MGVLAVYGEGPGLMDLFNYSTSQLVEMKHWTKKEAVTAKKVLDDAIATVG